MNSKRTYYLMLGLVALLTLSIIGGAYGASQVLTKKSMDLVMLKAKLKGYNQQQVNLAQAKRDVAKYNELYNIAKVIVPENKNQAETIRQITKLAEQNMIRLGSISFPVSSLGAGSTGAAAGNANKPTLTTPKTASSTAKADLSQLTPVVGSPGVYVLEITASTDAKQPASYPQLISFLSSLEKNRLTAEVTSVNIVPDTSVPNRFSFTLSLNSYIKP